jgi:hypothetical protein
MCEHSFVLITKLLMKGDLLSVLLGRRVVTRNYCEFCLSLAFIQYNHDSSDSYAVLTGKSRMLSSVRVDGFQYFETWITIA